MAIDTQGLLNDVYDPATRALRTQGASGGTATSVTIPADTAAAATLTNVAGSASNVTLQAANTARKGWVVFNDSTAALNVKFGATASATSFTTQIGSGQYYEMPKPIWAGIIDGIWTSATGAARITELT